MSDPVAGQFLKVSTPSDGVALVLMSRSPVNAFSRAFWREIPLIFNRLSQDDSIRVVVLASSERMFTAGLDLVDVGDFATSATDPATTALLFRPLIEEFQAAITSIEKCRVPVIAAVHGLALGLGVDILSACDVRYAAETAEFSIKEVDVGMAADIGSLARVPKIIGNESFTREVAFTARNFSASEALSAGFLSAVVKGEKKTAKQDVLAKAMETAKLISSKSTVAVIGTKHLILHSRDHSVHDNLAYTTTWNQAMLQSDDFRNRIQAFLKKSQAPQAKL